MATTPQALLTAAQCYDCNAVSEYQLGLMKLGLLRQILLASTPMADTSPQALLTAANCYNCYATSPYLIGLMELALLAQIVDAGGGGGAGVDWIIWEDTGPNPSGPPPDPTKSVMVRFRDGHPPVTWDPVAGAYF